MGTSGVRRSTDALGDDAVVAATGQTRAAWFALLDGQGATGWTHRDIAAWLVEEQRVDGWWAQSLTVAYEQERGMRAPGQRADGSFEANASKTVTGTPEEVFVLVADDAARTLWLDPGLADVGASAPLEVVGATPHSSVRLRWPARAVGAPEKAGRVVVGLYPAPATRDAPSGRTRVGVGHGGLPGPDDVARLKEFWSTRLATLAELAADRAAR